VGGETVNAVRTLAIDYARAYRDCYRWLYGHVPPWRWLLAAAVLPGTPAWRELADLRREAQL
jgi:hypothetical protein